MEILRIDIGGELFVGGSLASGPLPTICRFWKSSDRSDSPAQTHVESGYDGRGVRVFTLHCARQHTRVSQDLGRRVPRRTC